MINILSKAEVLTIGHIQLIIESERKRKEKLIKAFNRFSEKNKNSCYTLKQKPENPLNSENDIRK